MRTYQELTDHFVAQLQTGTRPWAKNWKTGERTQPLSRPLRSNGVPYRGVNVLSLWVSGMSRGFASPYWFTYLQSQEMGAQVRKGAKSAVVYKVGQFEKEGENGDARTLSYLKTYNVFNAAEIDGLPAQFYPAAMPIAPEAGRIAAAEDFMRRTGATVRHGADMPCYLPKVDLIAMPMLSDFDSPEAYYATLLHELTHWTAPKDRCDRSAPGRYGNPAYAFEELIAELGAAFLCSDLCISAEPREDHAQYIAGWIKALTEQPKALMGAASAAERAVTYLHGLQASVPMMVAAE